MIGLRSDRLGRRLGKAQVAFERLVVLFDLPPFLVERRDLFTRQRRITADQRDHSLAAVFVEEDLLGKQQGERNPFEPDTNNGVGFQFSGRHVRVRAIGMLRRVQGHIAIVFEGHHELFVTVVLDKHHVLRTGEPGVVENITKQ